MTRPSLVGLRGTKVTLDCTYKSTDRWYVIQWKRLYTGSDPVTITTLANSGQIELVPIFENDVDEDFTDRARTTVYMDVGSIDFKLSIYNFSCNDTGTYVCEVIGAKSVRNTTELTIAGKAYRIALY